MAKTKRIKRKTKLQNDSFVSVYSDQFRNFATSSRGFPFILSLTVICILFVLFRMKGVEQDYQFNKIVKNINSEVIISKELQAEKARLLSVRNLRRYAKKFKMKEPKQKQIIVIP